MRDSSGFNFIWLSFRFQYCYILFLFHLDANLFYWFHTIWWRILQSSFLVYTGFFVWSYSWYWWWFLRIVYFWLWKKTIDCIHVCWYRFLKAHNIDLASNTACKCNEHSPIRNCCRILSFLDCTMAQSSVRLIFCRASNCNRWYVPLPLFLLNNSDFTCIIVVHFFACSSIFEFIVYAQEITRHKIVIEGFPLAIKLYFLTNWIVYCEVSIYVWSLFLFLLEGIHVLRQKSYFNPTIEYPRLEILRSDNVDELFGRWDFISHSEMGLPSGLLFYLYSGCCETLFICKLERESVLHNNIIHNSDHMR
jgi:hypothetical protein